MKKIKATHEVYDIDPLRKRAIVYCEWCDKDIYRIRVKKDNKKEKILVFSGIGDIPDPVWQETNQCPLCNSYISEFKIRKK